MHLMHELSARWIHGANTRIALLALHAPRTPPPSIFVSFRPSTPSPDPFRNITENPRTYRRETVGSIELPVCMFRPQRSSGCDEFSMLRLRRRQPQAPECLRVEPVFERLQYLLTTKN